MVQRLTHTDVHIANPGDHTEITLQEIPNLKYKLRLLIESEERELQRHDKQTWRPAQRMYVLCSSVMHAI